MMTRLTPSALVAGVLLGAVTSPALAGPAPAPPPYRGIYQPQGVDEIGLWQQDDESERSLAASSVVIRDEKLTSYVKGVLCAAVGDDRCNATRVYILREPTFNATMSPNGTMRVFSGLLLRMRSEAELAAVLGHEFGHFERRHGLNGFRAMRKGSDVLAWGALLVSMAPTYSARSTYQSLELSVYGSLFRYGRDQEREADVLGLGYLNGSRLPPQAAAAVWQNLMGEGRWCGALSRGARPVAAVVPRRPGQAERFRGQRIHHRQPGRVRLDRGPVACPRRALPHARQSARSGQRGAVLFECVGAR